MSKIRGDKSKVGFVLLALFLGGFGIHRFYIRDIGLGILYLLFFWTGIPMLVAFVEAIVIGLSSDDPRFYDSVSNPNSTNARLDALERDQKSH